MISRTIAALATLLLMTLTPTASVLTAQQDPPTAAQSKQQLAEGKFKELTDQLNETEVARWNDIKTTFQRNQKFRGIDSGDNVARAIVQLTDMTEGLGAIREKLDGLGGVAPTPSRPGRPPKKTALTCETLHLATMAVEPSRDTTIPRPQGPH